jgi:hypothetical protein
VTVEVDPDLEVPDEVLLICSPEIDTEFCGDPVSPAGISAIVSEDDLPGTGVELDVTFENGGRLSGSFRID